MSVVFSWDINKHRNNNYGSTVECEIFVGQIYTWVLGLLFFVLFITTRVYFKGGKEGGGVSAPLRNWLAFVMRLS